MPKKLQLYDIPHAFKALSFILYDLLETIRLFIPLFVRRKIFSKQDIVVQMSSAQIPLDDVHL